MPKLIEHLKDKGVLHSPAIIRALEEVDRADFLSEDMKDVAYEDTALPIGGDQTMSQPYTVVFMLEQLQVRPGDIVLDVGYGSGWQTALLSRLVGPSGKIYAFEIVPQLCELGRKNLLAYAQLSKRTEFLCMNAKGGYGEVAPFDRIIAAAEVKTEVPQAWRDQLLPGGRMVYPKGNALVLEVKRPNGSFEVKTFPGFVFVPFIEE
ncbi:MAG TPA: methyltransferase domain-containing protein [Candidatus Paceibacterota bacterium]